MAEQVWTVGGSSGRLTSNTFNDISYPDAGRRNLSSYLTHPKGSGFTRNHRPCIYYKPGLDNSDNSEPGPMSQTHLDYQPPILPDRSASLPNISKEPSIFRQVRTEYQRQFVPRPTASTVSQNHVTIGSEGKNGFTKGHDLWLKTFEERCRCIGAKVRPSIFKPSFRESGFTRGDNALLVHPSSLIPTLQRKSNAGTVKTIGKKNLTGYSRFTTHYMSMFCQQNDWEKLKSGYISRGVINLNTDSGSS